MTLAWLAASFLLGIVFGAYADVPVTLSALSAITLAGVAIWFRGRSRLLLLVFAVGCLGLVRSPHVRPPESADLTFYSGRSLEVSGVVVGEPDARAHHVAYEIAVQTIQVRGKQRQVGGPLTVYTPLSIDLPVGEVVTLTGRLTLRAHSRLFLPPLRTSLMLFPRILDKGSTNGPATWLTGLRERLSAGIEQWLPEPEAALLIAITLGAHSASLGSLATILVTTGLIHLVAISGIKVALVAGTINSLVRPLGRRLLTLLTTLPVLWAYVALTGFTPSGMRSAGMWTLIFIAVALGRGTVGLVSLSAVAALMVAWEPSLLGDLGFLLSVTGTASIVALTAPLARLFHPLPSPFRDVLAVTLAAQVGTFPLVILGFNLLSLSGPLANTLVLPLVPLLIALGFLLGALAPVAGIAAPLAALAHMLLHVTIVLSVFLAAWVPAIRLPALALPLVTAYYAILVTVKIWFLQRANWAPSGMMPSRGREFAFGLATAASALTVSLLPAHADSGLRVDSYRSGTTVLRSPGHVVLIDGGPDPFAYRVLLGRLLPFDQRAIDAVIVTDPSATNVAALRGLLPRYTIGAVLDVGSEYPDRSYSEWRAALRSAHVPVYALRTGVRLVAGPFRVSCIGPDVVSPNARDSVGLLRITLPDRTLMVIGRASLREQHEAVFRGVPLRGDDLLVRGPVDPAFFTVVRPRLLVDTVSIGGGVASYHRAVRREMHFVLPIGR